LNNNQYNLKEKIREVFPEVFVPVFPVRIETIFIKGIKAIHPSPPVILIISSIQ